LEVLENDCYENFDEDHAHDQDIGEEINPRRGLISTPDCL